MKAPSNGFSANMDGDKKNINSELWHACAGPLASLPPVGSLVVYFPQGHSEQVAASMQKDTDSIPSYPSLPSKLICMLHNVILHADSETDEVYAQMTLQPVSKYDKDAFLASDLGLKQNKQPAEFFCKTLTASDTSTHGGFSVPRRAAEKIFPPLDFSMQPPAQELVARDLHDVAWTFRHIYRGQPKRHLLTTGWSVFVSTKRLIAGDSVLFIRDEKSQLLLGIRRANRQQPSLSSSVLSSDSMHIGILAAAAHAAANNSPFIIFYNPRASPSEFVIPLAKYQKAMYTQVSLGMRFRMMFETEESGVRRYMGTITGISDLDPIRWKNSQWRNLQVGWDESTAGERRNRVSLWEIEPAATPFYICPPPFLKPKFPGQPGLADDESEIENAFRRAMPWLADDMGSKDTQNSIFPGLSLVQWMSMQRQQQQQQNHQLMNSGAQSGYFPSMLASSLTNNIGSADSSRILNFQTDPSLPLSNPQFCTPKLNQQSQSDQLPQPPLTAWSHQLQQTQLRQPPPPPVQIQQQQAQPTPMNAGVIHEQIQQRQQQQLLQQHNNQQQLLQTQQQVGQTLPQAQLQNQILQQHLPQSQSPQQKIVAPTPQFQQNIHQQNHVLTQAKSLHQPQGEQQQPTVSQNPQQQFQLTQHHLQLQLLQKLQQQQQMLSQLSTQVPSPLPQQQNSILEQQQIIGTHFSQPQLSQTQEISSNPALQHIKLQALVRTSSAHTDVEVPSCSTSPSTNNCNLSSVKLPNKGHHGPSVVVQDKGIRTGPTSNLVQEIRSKPSVKIKNELPTSKEMDRLAYHGSAVTDQLDASSSATSFCLDGSNQANFSPFAFDGENQVDARNNLLFGVNIDGLTPDTLLSRGFDSGKDLQNLLSSYNQKDIETELSSAGINSQPFSVGDMSFKPGCSNDPVTDENGVLNRGMWSSQQPQRVRTFTKVHKRGSVGRSIDVTRYRGYEELRHDLACMFGIGQLEDPYRSDWKLVYVDHENDILLVGDDPWEEFVSGVQSIKILSSSEVQQMGIDGDLVNLSMPGQTRSGSDSGNAWRGHYDDNSGVAFDR